MKIEEILEKIKAVREEVQRRYKAEIKGIFGSYARGEEREDSDIDQLVDFEEEASLFDLVGLSLFLEEKLNHKVDIISQRALREEIKPSVFREIIYV